MALTASIHHVEVALSDVDRGVYEALDLRVARHPSETLRYMFTRILAYGLSYEDGITFSKGGLSSAEEAPVAVFDPTGLLLHWIDVGAPSAERLHKATKAATRVSLFTHLDLAALRREAATRPIHRVDEIDVYPLDRRILDALEERVERNMKLELVRNEGQLYLTIGGATMVEAAVAVERLVAPATRP